MLSYILIVINLGVFLWSQKYPFIMEKGMHMPYRIVRKGAWYELVSSGFLHGGWSHLLLT